MLSAGLLQEYDGAGTLLRVYAHGQGVDEPLIVYPMLGGIPRRFLHSDHQGSLIVLSDRSGNPVAVNAYDSWGIPNVAPQGRFGFTGQAWLPELGMYYYKARIYSPTLGRFLQTDPIGYKDQMNLYAYVGNDPVNMRDPTGTCGASAPVWNCVVTGRQPGTGFRAPRITPNDSDAVNGHARYGDGSPREADFAQVDLSDLGGTLQTLAGRRGNRLNDAIGEARRTGGGVRIHMDEVIAGGGIGGRTPIGQQGGIGRFSVTIDGMVRSTRDGRWTLDGRVTGETDRQDYPSGNRNWVGERLTDYGRLRQWMGGGQDYDIIFRGSQNIRARGDLW